MSNTLLPCPFCGGEAKITARDVEPQGDPWYGKNIQTFVICTNCGACLFDDYFHDGFTDERKAIAAWNRRTGKDINVATNANRIRSMTDEELAEYIFDLGNGSEYCYGHCAYQDDCNAEGLDHNTCIKGVIDWLKQPVKEE
jgi:Lar family restriction alleviation protein